MKKPSDWTGLGVNASCAPAFELSPFFRNGSALSTRTVRWIKFLSLVACTLVTGLNNAFKRAHRALSSLAGTVCNEAGVL